VFLNVLLPLIIFEAGYSIKHTGVMRDAGAVLLFAILGTIISTVVTGVIVFGWSYSAESRLYHLPNESNVADGGGLFLALTFGALLSAMTRCP
jgi:NhaP-type Na+/H+ or K+/H+ antiporter